MKGIRSILLIAIAVAIGFLTGTWTTPPSRVIAPTIGTVQNDVRPVSLLFVYDGATIDSGTLTWKEGLTLFDATKLIAEQKKLAFESKDYGEMGVLVTGIGSKKNGSGKSYWQYWVNNEQVQIAADKYIMKAGDVVMWQFRESTM